MESSQVYSAPQTNLEMPSDETRMTVEELKYFTFDGRLNRMRYIAYYIGFTLLTYVALAIGGIFSLIPVLGPIVFGLGYFALMIFSIVYSISLGARRCHDLNWSAWWLLLFLVPLANLVMILLLLFMPGNKESNRFGKRPPENTTGVKVLAIGGFVLMVASIGILTAVAIPAYQDYVERSEAAAASYYNEGQDW